MNRHHPGPSWTVPIEVVRACAVTQGTVDLTRLSLKDAKFQPHAVVWLAEGGFTALCTFEEPAYPGRAQELAVRLMSPARENAL
jgi:hypothetical protein